jgi:hypothetical protein
MDEEDTGSIDFREYLLGTPHAPLTRPDTASAALHSASHLDLPPPLPSVCSAGLAMVEKATSAGKGDKGAKDAAGDGEAMREEVRKRLLCRMLDVEDCGRVQLQDLLAVLQRTATLSPQQLQSYAQTLSQGAQGKGPDAETPAATPADAVVDDAATASAGASLSFDELLERLASDAVLCSALMDSLFAPLPLEVAPAKAEAAEAVVEAEAKGWRKRIREGMGKVRRRFV